MANGMPFLGTPRDLRIVSGEGPHVTECPEALGIAQRHPLRALEEHEVTQRPLAKRHQRDLDVLGIPAGENRKVGPLEMRRGTQRRQDIGRERQVQHLLLDDVDDG